MCRICEKFDLDLDDREDGIAASHKLTDILDEAHKAHPWNFLVAPMAPSTRRWYDLNHPDRKTGATDVKK